MPNRQLTFAAAALFSAGSICAQQPRDLTAYLLGDRAAEIALSRSAAPRHVSDSATALVLTKSGYIEVARGTNGFTCFVQRSFFGSIGDPGFWDPAIHAPICMNPAAVRTVLREMLKRTEWIMAGVTPAEIAVRTNMARPWLILIHRC
jgi:hypothetical protein